MSRNKRHSTSSSVCIMSDSHVNFRYLSSPQKQARLRNLSYKKKELQAKVNKLRNKLTSLVETDGITLDEVMSSDFHQIIREEDQKVKELFPVDSFKNIFWDHQKQNLQRTGDRVRWHPLMIKWCLYLRHQSSKAYEAIRESGCISLEHYVIILTV